MMGGSIYGTVIWTTQKPMTDEGGHAMNEKFYLFTFTDGSIYEMTCGISLKDAIWEMAKHTGISSEMFRKCISGLHDGFGGGYEENDVDGLVALFNHFCYTSQIDRVYIVETKLYPKKEDT